MIRLLTGLILTGVGCCVAKETPAWVTELEAATPTSEHKLNIPKDDNEARSKWRKWVKDYAALPADEVRANPTASIFPGDVKAGTVHSTGFKYSVDMNMPRWQFTGLYAAPGEKITLKLGEGAPKDMKVRIGCHTDSIFRTEKWSRFPSISWEAPLAGGTTEIANPFGGLVYIEVPRDAGRGGVNIPTYGGYIWLDENITSAKPATVEITLDGGVKAPVYQLGKTTPEQWAAQLSETGAPWGEMAGRNFIFSLPLDVLRSVKDPEGVMRYWDKVLDEAWKFGGWRGQRNCPERFVPDRQISAGFLHSGYPFMGQYIHAKEVVDLDTLKSNGNWGFFHELGHNHEGQAYTFDGYVEVVVNLHTLYLMKTMCGLDPDKARPKWIPAAELKKLTGGSTDAFARLALYVPLIDTFGFDSLTKTFQTYWVEGGGARTLKQDQEKTDAFVERYSTTVGKNCADYFARVSLKCSPAVAAKLEKLPKFMPPGLEDAPAPVPAAPGK